MEYEHQYGPRDIYELVQIQNFIKVVFWEEFEWKPANELSDVEIDIFNWYMKREWCGTVDYEMECSACASLCGKYIRIMSGRVKRVCGNCGDNKVNIYAKF